MTEVEKRLMLLVGDLDAEAQQTLLAFAEFLAQRGGQALAALPPPARMEAREAVPETPQKLPRPEQETVVGAIKRLRLSFPMLDRRALLNDTANAMSKHALGGAPAASVIDELELVFERHYQRHLEKSQSASEA